MWERQKFYFLFRAHVKCHGDRIRDLVHFVVKKLINLLDELRLHLTTCNFTIHFYDNLLPEAGIMDTELLIYIAFGCRNNLNIFSLLFSIQVFSYIFYHFLKGNTDIIIISPVVVKSNYLAIPYCKWCWVMIILFGGYENIKINKGKFIYGQEPPSEESTTTECGVNYQLTCINQLK